MREFVSKKIFHCKPNLAKSRNLYGTSCVDNLPCPWDKEGYQQDFMKRGAIEVA